MAGIGFPLNEMLFQDEELLGAGYFAHNFLRRRARIGSRDDRPAHYNVIRAGFDGLCGSGSSRLIVLLLFTSCLRSTDARRHDQELAAARFADGLRFLNGSDYAVDATFL